MERRADKRIQSEQEQSPSGLADAPAQNDQLGHQGTAGHFQFRQIDSHAGELAGMA